MSAPDCPRDSAGFCRIALLGECPGVADGVECDTYVRIIAGRLSPQEALLQAVDRRRKAPP